MKIVGYLKTSFIEWPGKISSVIFTPGCNFRCPFCHNADLVDPKKIKKLKKHKEKEILKDLKKRKKWIDGIVVTGGEPTLQPGLDSFLKKVKKLGFKVMLETNGSKPEVLEKLIKGSLVDFIAMDYKTTFSDYEKLVTPKVSTYSDPGSKRSYDPGFSVDMLKKSMQLILKSGLPFEFRTTLVPTIHDENVLLQMAIDLKRNLENCQWILQPFRPKNCLDAKFNRLKPYPQKQIKNFWRVAQKIIPETKLRGKD